MNLLQNLGCQAISLLLGAGPCLAQAPAAQPDLIAREDLTGIVAATRKIVSPRGVEQLLQVPINGAGQWLSIRGRDRRNPILLVLHGGPGSPTLPVTYTFQGPWEDYFTVVQWEQRGSGKTYASSDPEALAATMTVEQMTADTEEVIRYLLRTFGKRKVFLLGHSWGSVLGVAVARRHPEWLHAYLGVGQMINMAKSEAEGYRFALDQARAHHDEGAERELAALAPYPGAPGQLTLDRIGTQRKWLMRYGGLTQGREDYAYDAEARLLSPDYSRKELKAIDEGGLYSLRHLLGPMETFDCEAVTRFRCPVFLFEGRHDYATSHTLAARWFQTVTAPRKRFVWFEDSAHMVMQEEPGRFLYHLVTDLRPLAVRAGDGAPAGGPR